MRFAPTEPFLDSLVWGAAAKEPPAKFDAGGPSVRFLGIVLVIDGNGAIVDAIGNDRGLHAAIGCYIISVPVHHRSYAIR